MAYKLVQYDRRNVLKTSTGKESWTGEKQVYRVRRPGGGFDHDLLALRDEPGPTRGEPLLSPVMAGGARPGPPPSLAAVRAHCAAQVTALPEAVARLRDAAEYPVRYSGRLVAEQRAVKGELDPHDARASR
jgi:nicotinate phosphoribosyltransferase